MSAQTLHDLPSAAPALRLLVPPRSEPPYDDQLRLPATPVPVVPHALRLVPALPRDDEEWGGPRTALDALAPARPFALAFVQRLLEVQAGVRPLAQLQRDTTPDLYAHLEQVVQAGPAPRGTRPDGRAVRSVHVQTRPEGVAEVCATVKRPTPAGPRAAALALRLEGLGGRWCCTELAGL